MKRLILTLAMVGSSWAMGAGGELPAGFDGQRHMRVAEVKAGMKGYGLSVFAGKKVERFEVEVISVLKNFNPKQDVVLIRAAGMNLEHTGAIAGMSGSPIYLRDESGRERLIGAFAYGWPMVKDPLAGVQPIEYMLAMPIKAETAADGSAPPPVTGGKWSALESVRSERARMLAGGGKDGNRELREGRLRAMSLPLLISGVSGETVSALGSVFEGAGLAAMQAGGGTGGGEGKLEPGSVMAVPLLTGDIDMTAVGTCTEVLGKKVYGFGHPFTGVGPVELPMCAGEVQGVIPNLVTSFKLGTASRPLGTLRVDQSPGVGGELGGAPEPAPMQWRIRFADGSVDKEYHFQAAVHPQFTPMLASTAAFGSLSAARQLPHFNTVAYRMEIEFSAGGKIVLADRIVNVEPVTLFGALGAPIAAVTDNPFGRVLVKSVTGEIEVSDGAAAAELLHVGSSRQVYKPGETVRFFATLRPFRSVERISELEFSLPADLPDGNYTLNVSDVNKYLIDEQAGSPFRFTASTLDEVFAAIRELSALRSDAIYLRLTRTEPGIAMGRVSLAKMPTAQQQMLLGMGRPDVIAYLPSVTRQVKADYVIEGSATLSIQVSKSGRVATTRP